MSARFTLRPAESRDRPALAQLLVAAVNRGDTSLSFLPPLPLADAERFWAEPHPLHFVAEQDGELAGTVELRLAWQPNAVHRAEVVKLIVDPRARRAGLGRALMQRCEDEALRRGRTLLILDTRGGDVSNDFYLALGWTRAGSIPGYVRERDGALRATVIYYKALTARG